MQLYEITLIIYIVYLIHVSTIHVAILRGMPNEQRIRRDITDVCEPHRCKILSFENTRFKIRT
jgi:hypothetical protein